MNPVTPERRGSIINCNGLGPIEEPSGDGLGISKRRLTVEEMLSIESSGGVLRTIEGAVRSVMARHGRGEINPTDLEKVVSGVEKVAFELRTYANSMLYRNGQK